MLEGFATGETLVDVDAHEPTDEILGRIADFVPIRRVEFEFTLKNQTKATIKNQRNNQRDKRNNEHCEHQTRYRFEPIMPTPLPPIDNNKNNGLFSFKARRAD